MDRAESGAREHRDDGLGDHRHVDEDAVPFLHPVRSERARKQRDVVAKLSIGVRLTNVGDRAVVDQRSLVAACRYMTIEGVVTGVENAAGEPAVEGLVRTVEDCVPAFEPIDVFGDFAPEPLGILERALPDLMNGCHELVSGEPEYICTSWIASLFGACGLTSAERWAASSVEKTGMSRSIAYPPPSPPVLLLAVFALAGCKSQVLTADASNVAVLYDEPVGCEKLGEVEGFGGGLGGAYTKPSINNQSAENDALNKAAELGATHLLLYPREIAQGDGRAPDYQDTQPAMAHGSGTGSTVNVRGAAYKCALATPQTKSEMSITAGSAFIEVKAPESISLAPLGPLTSIRVYQRAPLPSGKGIGETEVFVTEDDTAIRQVAGSLQKVAKDPMKYIPTHRVEFVGELGTQSLLYGFGYLQYAGEVYRLTDGVFEETLRLVEPVEGPEVVGDTPGGDGAEDAASSEPPAEAAP